jgi:hypothetical protein
MNGKMINSLPYIAISIVALVIVAVLVFAIRGKEGHNRLSTLSGIAFGCIIAGLLFGENRILGYGLLGLGVLLAVVDIFMKGDRR